MREQRLQFMLSPAELALLDNFRFMHRMPSRAAAVRELLQNGLAASGTIKDPTGMKSANIAVFGHGENSHDGKD